MIERKLLYLDRKSSWPKQKT